MAQQCNHILSNNHSICFLKYFFQVCKNVKKTFINQITEKPPEMLGDTEEHTVTWLQ